MAVTATFGGTDITSVATTGTTIIIENAQRPLRKPVTRHKVEIPGRAGSWDFGGGVERDYTVSMDIAIKGNTTTQIMTCAAALDTLLNGKGDLIFSDAPTVTHSAQIYSQITLDHVGGNMLARVKLEFECDA